MHAKSRLIIIGMLWLAVITVLFPPTSSTADTSQTTALKAWTQYDRTEEYGVVTDTDIPITMQDGVILTANVYRPAASVNQKFPVILTQTPYNKNGPLGAGNDYFVKRGYVHVVVDVRGTGGSQGTWDSFGQAEQHDGYELVQWAATQTWSDGNVGLWGASYMAINQLFTAAQQPPALKAIFPIVPMADTYRDIVMSGGQVNTGFIPLWLGLVSSTSILPPTYTASDPVRATTTVIGHAGGVTNFQSNTLTSSITGGDVAYDGPFSRQRSPIEQIDKIKVPAFVVGGLHDLFQRGEPLIYERLKTRVNAKLLIGNWTHGDFGSGLPADGVPNLNQISLRWFDQYLKGMNTDVNSMPSVTQYVLGENRFEVQSDWPLPQTTVKNYYLRSNQLLADSAPNSPEKTDSMLQQPVCGVCSGSTNQWLIGTMGATPCAKDNRLTELSEITYTTPTLTKDLKLSGPIGAEIFVTTSAKDAVLSVRLTDVSPDGTSTELTAGWLAASLRQVDNVKSRIKQGYNLQPWHPFTRDSILPVLAGEPMKLNIEIFPTNAVIKAGHKLRVAVGPSDFPHAVSPVPAQTNQLGGVVNILHDDAHPSFVSLPVVR